MRDEKVIRYEKPMLEKYRFAVTVAVVAGDTPQGDISEICDSDFDE